MLAAHSPAVAIGPMACTLNLVSFSFSFVRLQLHNLVLQVTIPEGTTFSGHFNAQGRSVAGQKDWQEYGICFSTGSGCQDHPVPEEL